MRYWFFNGNDVVGPYTPKELVADKSFNAASLVCPELFSDQEDHWQPAQTFEQLRPLLLAPETEDTPQTLEQEMDTLLKEKSPLFFEKTTTDGPGLQLPQKPAKPGPIEDYFNRIQKEDLGDILGIPDPADNSDMDLAHALERQLAQTSSTRRRERELNTVDERTAAALESELPSAQETHHIATATEVFATRAPLARDGHTPAQPEREPALPEREPATTSSLPPLPAQDFTAMPTADTAPVLPLAETPAPAVPLAGQTPAVPAPAQPAAKTPSASPQPDGAQTPANTIIPDPALLRAEKVEVNSIKARLKQTQEMKDILTQARPNPPQGLWERKATVGLLAGVVIIGGIFILGYSRPHQPATTQPAAAATATTAQQLLEESPVPPAPAAVVTDKRQRALQIVQNYPLSGARGTLAAYLNRIYQPQLAQGYAGTWQAEPLHKDAYVVKYQLTKTRKEPIIYIFQADVSAGKLTGALNNISLDLVGKIQQ